MNYNNLIDLEIKGIHPISLLKYHLKKTKLNIKQSKNKHDRVICKEENLNDSLKQDTILIPPVLMSNIKKEEEENLSDSPKQDTILIPPVLMSNIEKEEEIYHRDEDGNIIEKRLEQLNLEKENILSMNSSLLGTQYKIKKKLGKLLEEKSNIESKIKLYKESSIGKSNDDLDVLYEFLKIINNSVDHINEELNLIKNKIDSNDRTLDTVNQEIESITIKLKIIIDEENKQKEVIEFYKKAKDRKSEIENIWCIQDERMKEISKEMKESYEVLDKKQKEYEDLLNYYYGLYKTLWDEEFSKVDEVTLYFSKEQKQKEKELEEEINLLKTKMENLKEEISKILEEGRSYVSELDELEFAMEKAEELFGKEFLNQNVDIKKRKMEI